MFLPKSLFAKWGHLPPLRSPFSEQDDHIRLCELRGKPGDIFLRPSKESPLIQVSVPILQLVQW